MTKTRVQLRELATARSTPKLCDSFLPPYIMTNSLLSTIPPERVGLNGEYDHGGLAKRVWQAFEAEVSLDEIAGLRVTQRGKVVVLMGSLPEAAVLERLITIALTVKGAIEVETTGIRFR